MTDTPEAPPALPAWLKTFPDPVVTPEKKLSHFESYKYLIAYDIRDDKRLRKLFVRLKDFGTPIQKSVFECLLRGSQVEEMWIAVTEIIDERVDWVVLFRLCKPFDEAIRHIGFYDPQLLHSDDVIFI